MYLLSCPDVETLQSRLYISKVLLGGQIGSTPEAIEFVNFICPRALLQMPRPGDELGAIKHADDRFWKSVD